MQCCWFFNEDKFCGKISGQDKVEVVIRSGEMVCGNTVGNFLLLTIAVFLTVRLKNHQLPNSNGSSVTHTAVKIKVLKR